MLSVFIHYPRGSAPASCPGGRRGGDRRMRCWLDLCGPTLDEGTRVERALVDRCAHARGDARDRDLQPPLRGQRGSLYLTTTVLAEDRQRCPPRPRRSPSSSPTRAWSPTATPTCWGCKSRLVCGDPRRLLLRLRAAGEPAGLRSSIAPPTCSSTWAARWTRSRSACSRRMSGGAAARPTTTRGSCEQHRAKRRARWSKSRESAPKPLAPARLPAAKQRRRG